MITVKDSNLEFLYMGLFESRGEWIHPTVTIDSYELIFVTNGNVNIREGGNSYFIEKGQMLLLDPFVEHGGIEVSDEKISFYWLHFRTDNIQYFKFPKHSSPDAIRSERIFREIMQYSQKNDTIVAELILARYFLECETLAERRNKIAHEMYEYIRINSDKKLTVNDVAKHFGYAPDHISRIIKKEFGICAKEMIIEKRLAFIESVLINTNETIKNIAERCGFEDENIFVKFFKYHSGKTPTEQREEFFRVHMNSK